MIAHCKLQNMAETEPYELRELLLFQRHSQQEKQVVSSLQLALFVVKFGRKRRKGSRTSPHPYNKKAEYTFITINPSLVLEGKDSQLHEGTTQFLRVRSHSANIAVKFYQNAPLRLVHPIPQVSILGEECDIGTHSV
jgi:hypothetical protein